MHLMGHEESRGEKQKSNNKSFVIREIPIQRMKSSNVAELRKGKSFCDMNMMDYDTPELVVFLQEDRAVSGKGKWAIGDWESYQETMSSSFAVADATPRSPGMVKDVVTNKCDFRNLMMMAEGHQPTEVMEEEEEEEEVVRLFIKKDGECSSCATGTSSCRGVSHKSSDSMSSTHSFTFPILQPEWSGSPVRMAEPDTITTSQSTTRLRWRKIFCPCCRI